MLTQTWCVLLSFVTAQISLTQTETHEEVRRSVAKSAGLARHWDSWDELSDAVSVSDCVCQTYFV